MKDKGEELDFDGDEDDTEIDAHEYEISSTGSRTINWRRIESMKEKFLLKKQIEDYGDWHV
jgi:hypothetical protein